MLTVGQDSSPAVGLQTRQGVRQGRGRRTYNFVYFNPLATPLPARQQR